MGEEKGGAKATVAAGESRSTNPFNVSLSLSPLRLSANARNSVNLLVKVKNISDDPQLVSVDVMLPRNCMLGFDSACINKVAEKRAGELKAGESVEVPVEIWANNQSKSGSFAVDVTVYSHYIGYEKVLSYIKKSTPLRVV